MIHSSDSKPLNTVGKPDDIGFILSSIKRAEKIGDTSEISTDHTHKIDLSNRWLYDKKTGNVAILTMPTTTVYRIRDEDRSRFESLLRPGSVPPAH